MSSVLPEQQKKYGQKKYMFFSIFNGFSVALLAESTLILYALKMGIPDYIVGIMSSFLFLGMPFIFIGKSMVSRIGVTKTVSFAWFMRSISTILAAVAPIIVYYTSSTFIGASIIVISAFSYYSFRGIGCIGWTPILGEITSESDRGRYSSKLFQNFNITYFLGIFALIVVLAYWDTIETFQIVICLGCIFGFFAAYNVLQVPESSTPKISATVSIKGAILFLVNYKDGRKLVWVQTIYFIGITLTLPYSMLALKEGYHIQDYKAMQFILIQLVGAIIISLICKKLIDKIGSQKIIICLFLFMILASFMWAVSPKNFSLWYIGLTFLFIGAAQMGGYLSLITYFLDIIPSTNRVGSTLIITIVSSLITGILGAVIGAGLLKLLESFNLNSHTTFQYFFTVIFIILSWGVLLIFKLEKISLIKLLRKKYKTV